MPLLRVNINSWSSYSNLLCPCSNRADYLVKNRFTAYSNEVTNAQDCIFMVQLILSSISVFALFYALFTYCHWQMCVKFLHEKMFLKLSYFKNTIRRVMRFYVNLNEESSRGKNTNGDFKLWWRFDSLKH